jgi:hypothetical protein
MNATPAEPLYVISLQGVFRGAILLAITMAIHGCGMKRTNQTRSKAHNHENTL